MTDDQRARELLDEECKKLPQPVTDVHAIRKAAKRAITRALALPPAAQPVDEDSAYRLAREVLLEAVRYYRPKYPYVDLPITISPAEALRAVLASRPTQGRKVREALEALGAVKPPCAFFGIVEEALIAERCLGERHELSNMPCCKVRRALAAQVPEDELIERCARAMVNARYGENAILDDETPTRSDLAEARAVLEAADRIEALAPPEDNGEDFHRRLHVDDLAATLSRAKP